MKKKAVIVFASLAVLVFFASQALTVTRGPADGTDIGENVVAALIALDLGDAQKQELALILKKGRADQKKAVEDFRAALSFCVKEALKENIDEDLLRDAYRKAAAAGEDVVVKKAKMTAELRNVLTEDQKNIMRSFKARFVTGIMDRYESRQGLVNAWVAAHAGPEVE